MLRLVLLGVLAASSMFAFSAGPPVRRTGAQIDGGTACNACHQGTLNPDTVGFVRIEAVNYTPGQRQTIKVTVSHPEARAWGFEVTARLASNLANKAGVFTLNSNVRLRCDTTGNVNAAPDGPCAENLTEFVMHNRDSYSVGGTNGAKTYEIEWTPPATNAGPVTFYAAGNAANFGGTNAGDRIYTTSLTIQPASAPAPPSVTQGGIISAAQFGASTTVAPGTWIEIYGSNLAPSTADWINQFQGSVAPTTLAGVRVLIGGTPAALSYVSPTQINAQVPASTAVGPVTLRVENANGSSEQPITMARTSAGVFAPAEYKIGDRQFVGFIRNSDRQLTRTVRAGEVLLMFGIGFGPTDPAVAPGNITPANSPLASTMTVRFGDTPATVSFAGLPASFVGLYQFNLVVPNVAAGDMRLNIDLGGTPIAQTLFVSVVQ